MIYYKCDNCGENLEAPASLASQNEKCPSCGFFNTVPESQPATKTENGAGKKTQPTEMIIKDKSNGPLVFVICLLLAVLVGLFLIYKDIASVRTELTSIKSEVSSIGAGLSSVQ